MTRKPHALTAAVVVVAVALDVAAPPGAAAGEDAAPEGAAAKPYLMATLGDSISAALFANTALEDFTVDLSSHDTEALLNVWRPFEKKYTLSWSAGSEIPSHFQRLRDYVQASEGAGVEILSVAVTGNRAEHLVGQARQVYSAAVGGKYRGLKYATIMIGANDLCFGGGEDGTPGSVLRDSLKAALGILASIPQEEPVRVLVSAIPNVPSVAAPAIRDRVFFRDITCGDLWAKVGICQGFLNWKTPEEYKAKLALVERKNAAIQQALSQAAEEHPGLRVAYSDRIFQSPAQPENMAVDCFHPNENSQRRIAAELWQDQPWFPPQDRGALARLGAQLAEARARVEKRLSLDGPVLAAPAGEP